VPSRVPPAAARRRRLRRPAPRPTMFYLMLTGLIRVGIKLIKPVESLFYLMLTGLIRVGIKLIKPVESYPIRLFGLHSSPASAPHQVKCSELI
jgi:hypothetical protein